MCLSSLFSERKKKKKKKYFQSALVDEFGPKNCSVFEEDGVVFNVFLSFTDIEENANKFYLMQLLSDDSKPKFHCFKRWGRVRERLNFVRWSFFPLFFCA